MRPPVIEGPRIVLTALQRCNIGTHFRWNNDPALNDLDSEEPFAPESFGSFARRFEALADNASADSLDLEIHLRQEGDPAGGKLIGVAFLSDISRTHRHACIGLTIGAREEWGRGYGREALELLLRYSFGELGLHRVTAHAYAFNEAWRHLLTGMGFTLEGHLRDHLYRRGRYWDKACYALLDADFKVRSEVSVHPYGDGAPGSGRSAVPLLAPSPAGAPPHEASTSSTTSWSGS